MEREQIQELIIKYNEGQADPAELKLIEKLIEEGVIDLSQLTTLAEADRLVNALPVPPLSADLDDRFYDMLRQAKHTQQGFSWSRFFAWPELAPRLAFASITLLLGLAIGYYAHPSSDDSQVAQLSNQVTELKEMMMLSLLEKESATERLRAVSLTEELSASTKVTHALVQTLNEDENVNVRLAALEALKPYVRDHQVRQELVKSIARQDSPLVQVALAELMAAIQEKSSVKEFERILKNDRTPKEIKKRIEESIGVMI